MNKEDLIKCFEDTVKISISDKLANKTKKAILSNKVYYENSHSNTKRIKNYSYDIIVEKNTTFNAAKKYSHSGRVAVLNFANPVNPGGGVQLGAMAQEECLCRSSNLYLCLSADNVRDGYYSYHSKPGNHFWSDRLIYTRDVTVFKNDNDIPQLLPAEEWFDVDVITCAAPYLAERKYTNLTALSMLFKSRIKNILESAIDNDVDVLILGAFGCGAFKNPPETVAEAFKRTIMDYNYFKFFKKIVFAIKPSNEFCPNYTVFDNWLTERPDECQLLITPFEKRFNVVPPFIKDIVRRNHDFEYWIGSNKYFRKQFSVLGDSISTLDGYNPRGYNVFYKEDNCKKTDVTQMSDTWWGKVIDFFGGELLVNNSWSGSRVTKLTDKERLFPSGCSDERTSTLHINDVRPDVILVYLGTNDWAFGAKTGNDTRLLGEDDNELFDEAYSNMIKKLKCNYPQSEIWCCTLCETYISKRPDFQFPHKYAGTHIEEYNEIIRKTARYNSCRLVDLYDYRMAYDSIDGSHPTNTGMNTIATMVIRSIVGSDADQFLDCEDGQHAYKVVEEYPGGTRCICSRCGKTKHKSKLPPAECPDAKALSFLEAGMAAFAKSDHKDDVSLKLIIESLIDAPLYFPVEIDFEAMLGSVDPMKLKPGDVLQPTKDVRMRIMTLINGNGVEIVPTFTSNDEANKGPDASVIRLYPQDYLPKLMQINKLVLINPFSDNKFFLSRQMIADVLLPLVQKKVLSKTDIIEQPADNSEKTEGNQTDIVGKILYERYLVLKYIPGGCWSSFYIAEDIKSNKKLSIKVYDKKQKDFNNTVYELILQEPEMLMKLNHPAIPRIIDIIEDDRYISIIREYFEGESLDIYIKKNGPLPAEKVVKLGKQLCGTLSYLHNLTPPHIHRDMKPRNIILEPSGKLKLIDFGIMRLYDPKKSCDTTILGTKGYAAPEQYGGLGQTDARTDIFGLGVTLHELVTGIDPKEPGYVNKPICQFNPDLPKGLEYIISKCTEVDPKNRYQTCSELMNDLNNYMSLPKPKGFFGKIFGKQ